LRISERNGSSDVGMYRCFLDKGTFQEKRTLWLLPTLPPPCGYRRLVHHVLPHKVHLTCLPLLQDHSTCAALTPPLTPSYRLDIHRPPAPLAQPSHPRRSRPSLHRHHTAYQQTHTPGALRERDTKANISTHKTCKEKRTAIVPRKSVRGQKQYYHSHVPSTFSPLTAPSSSTPS